jgi:adenylate cyclase
MSGKPLQCIVMFADVAGSTAIYENLGDIEARDRISRALNTLISICKRHKGVLVKTIGDEILVYFHDADLSILAASAIQETMEDHRSPETVGISIRIGMHYGSVIFEGNDIFGDTVNVAARVVAMSKARQILFTSELANRISSSELSYKTRQYDRIRVKGKEDSLDVYLYSWEEDADITNMATASNFTNPSKMGQAEGLTLTYGDQVFKLDFQSPTINIGRGKDCDLIVSGDLISRFHARLEVRRGKFVLSDQSTNGTYLRTRDGQNFFLRQEDLALFGSGMISFGKNIDKGQGNLVSYSCD